MKDDMPLRLSSRSPLKLLDRRLDELALPQGTKLDRWTRLEKRERADARVKIDRRRLTQNLKLEQRDVVEKVQSR